MTKREARNLIKKRGTSRLDKHSVAVLLAIVDAAFKKDAPNVDIESLDIRVSIVTLLAKTAIAKADTVYAHLQRMEKEHKIITINKEGVHNAYRMHLSPMLEWETAIDAQKKKHAIKLKRRREARRERKACRREIPKGKFVVEVSGGSVQNRALIDGAVEVEVLDWDNFKADPVGTWNEWPEWLQEHFRVTYPEEYAKDIQAEDGTHTLRSRWQPVLARPTS
ncbi:MAG: hypothetical protein ACLPHP_04995 [Candidatus Sulfotelmatobacter sp.]